MAEPRADTARWRYEVFRGMTLLGYTDWLAWRESDQEEVVQATTPEDIEAMAPAIQAVRRGFESMEQAVREQREAKNAD